MAERWFSKRRQGYQENWKLAFSCFRRGQSPREAQLRRFFIEPVLERIGREGLLLVGVGFGLLLIGASPILLGTLGEVLGWTEEQTAGLGCLTLLAIPLLLCAIPCIVLGAVTFLGLGLFRIISSGAPDASAVESWLHSSILRLRTHSLAKLGLVEDDVASFEKQPPVLTPILWPTSGVDSIDLLWRVVARRGFFGVYRVCFVHLTPDRLGVYLCDFNFLRDISLNDEAMELGYQDVVSLRTNEKSSSYTLPTGKKLQQEQSYSLMLTSGHSLHLGTAIPSLGRLLDEDDLPANNVEVVVAGLRSGIRDQMRALTGGGRRLPAAL